jgi:hypothetical protein
MDMANTNDKRIPAFIEAPGFKLMRAVTLEVQAVIDVEAWEATYGPAEVPSERFLRIDDDVRSYVENAVRHSAAGEEGCIKDVDVLHP